MSQEKKRAEMRRALRDILLDAPDSELREVVAAAGEDFDSLAASGRAAAERALKTAKVSEVRDLHRGLGALLQMLRRREQVSIDDLARLARVDPSELRNLELDPTFDPNPRTVVQLAKHFKLPSRSLVVLSGAVRVEDDVRQEAVRFAASAEGIAKLTREEQKLLTRFVGFLRDHTDQ